MSFLDKLRSRIFGPPATGAGAPSDPRSHFMSEVEGILRSMPSVGTIKPDPGRFAFELRNAGKDHTFFLENIFSEMREVPPEKRAERIRAIVASVGAQENNVSWDEVQERLVPLVRPCTLFMGAVSDPTKLPIARPFAPFLVETVGIDSEQTTQYVSPATVQSWDVPVEKVFDVARANAAASFGEGDVASYDETAGYPIWHVARDDSYESSRLLLPGWLASFRSKVAGRPVAIVPERSKLIVGGDGDERCLRRLIETAVREYGSSPRAISPALYTVVDDTDQVVPLLLHGHALAHDVGVGHVQLAAAEYDKQRSTLQEQVGDDVFVANYVGLRQVDGTPIGMTTWSEDVPTLLPVADRIAFVIGPTQPNPEVFNVWWDDVARLAGAFLERDPSLNPPRCRTVGWPDRETIAKLRAASSGAS
jgi:hypothetical protein